MNQDTETSSSLWTIHTDGSDAREIAKEAAYPAWSPDGKTIAYIKVDSDGSHIALMDTTGRDQRILVDSVPDTNFSKCAECRSNATDSGLIYVKGLTWSADARHIAFQSNVSILYVAHDIWIADVHTGNLKRLTRDTLTYPQGDDEDPTWSPDGTRIAYSRWSSNRHRYEVWVINADGSDPQKLYAHPTDNVGIPAWQPTGQELSR